MGTRNEVVLETKQPGRSEMDAFLFQSLTQPPEMNMIGKINITSTGYNPDKGDQVKDPTLGEMTTGRYESLAMLTEADQEVILRRLSDLGPAAMELDNGARGLAGDAGEVSSAVMKFIEYGKPLDFVNLLEEVGDCLWRLAQVCRAAAALSGKPFNFDLAMKANIAKLEKRYPEKYTDEAATNRDRDAEREAVSGYTTGGNDKFNFPDAMTRANYLMSAPSDRVPTAAKDFQHWLTGKVGASAEVSFMAFVVYAQLSEGLPCEDKAYQPDESHRKWFTDHAAKSR